MGSFSKCCLKAKRHFWSLPSHQCQAFCCPPDGRQRSACCWDDCKAELLQKEKLTCVLFEHCSPALLLFAVLWRYAAPPRWSWAKLCRNADVWELIRTFHPANRCSIDPGKYYYNPITTIYRQGNDSCWCKTFPTRESAEEHFKSDLHGFSPFLSHRRKVQMSASSWESSLS